MAAHRPSRSLFLETSVHLPAPPDEVFRFVGDARNLDRVTPGWFRLRILNPLPERMGVGTTVDYRMTLFRIPFPWRSRVVAWEPPHLFTYVQDRGPYGHFEHEHLLEAEAEGTRVVDRLWYTVPGGALGDRLLVRRMLEGIFAWRAVALQRHFAGRGRLQPGSRPPTSPSGRGGPPG